MLSCLTSYNKKRDQYDMKSKDFFHFFCKKSSQLIGNPYSFIVAVLLIIGWIVSGPFFKFSDTWQLVINTGTIIVTFLIVFLIQNTQNRDSQAIQIKLDELIRIHKLANNSIMNLGILTDEQLKELEEKYRQLGGEKKLSAKKRH